MENLTEKDKKLIIVALKQMSYNAEKQLNGFALGDVERGYVKEKKEECDELLIKIGA